MMRATAYGLLAMLALSGCATSSGNQLAMKGASIAARDGFDQAYMDKVQSASNRRGVTVIWVNPPRQRKPKG